MNAPRDQGASEMPTHRQRPNPEDTLIWTPTSNSEVAEEGRCVYEEEEEEEDDEDHEDTDQDEAFEDAQQEADEDAEPLVVEDDKLAPEGDDQMAPESEMELSKPDGGDTDGVVVPTEDDGDKDPDVDKNEREVVAHLAEDNVTKQAEEDPDVEARPADSDGDDADVEATVAEAIEETGQSVIDAAAAHATSSLLDYDSGGSDFDPKNRVDVPKPSE